MGIFGLNTDLLQQLTFYGSYHRNKWNQAIHFVFVPLILWAFAVWFCYTGPLFHVDLASHAARVLPDSIARLCELNGGLILIGGYGLYYTALEFFAGLSWLVCIGAPMYLTANLLRQESEYAWAWSLGVNLFSWYMQIHPGHAVLEKRRPALIDSLLQSLVLGPLFVWLELLFVLGYRPALHAELLRSIEANVATIDQSKQPLLNKEPPQSETATAEPAADAK